MRTLGIALIIFLYLVIFAVVIGASGDTKRPSRLLRLCCWVVGHDIEDGAVACERCGKPLRGRSLYLVPAPQATREPPSAIGAVVAKESA